MSAVPYLGSEGAGSEIQGHVQLDNKSGTSLGYVRPGLKIKQNKLSDLNLILRTHTEGEPTPASLPLASTGMLWHVPPPPPLKKSISTAFEVGWTSNIPSKQSSDTDIYKGIIYIRQTTIYYYLTKVF